MTGESRRAFQKDVIMWRTTLFAALIAAAGGFWVPSRADAQNGVFVGPGDGVIMSPTPIYGPYGYTYAYTPPYQGTYSFGYPYGYEYDARQSYFSGYNSYSYPSHAYTYPNDYWSGGYWGNLGRNRDPASPPPAAWRP